MLVTKIQAVTKQKYRIELDGQPAFVIYKGELSRYGIKEGQEIPGPVYQELVGQVLTKRAKLRAMHLLESMDRTRAELERKLQAGEYPREAVEAALAYVESFGYLDDRRYARHYVECKKEGRGKARLKMELAQKGVDRSIIEEVLEEAELDDCRDTIRELVRKRRRGSGPMDDRERQRIYGYLMRKGFSSSDILSVLKEKEDFCLKILDRFHILVF